MKPNQITSKQITLISIAGGLIGGALLVTATILSHKGYWIIAGYAAAMLATFAFLRSQKSMRITYKAALIIGMSVFTLMSYVLYIYILSFEKSVAQINFNGHLLRFAMIVGGGAVISAILALIFTIPKQDSLQVS